MNKENFIKILKCVYDWAVNKGLNSTVAKIILGAVFGAVCALFFSSCNLHYSDHEKTLDLTILEVEEGRK